MIAAEDPRSFRQRMARRCADLIVGATPAQAEQRRTPREEISELAVAWIVKGHLWPQAAEACRAYRMEPDGAEGLIWEAATRIMASFAWEEYPPPDTRWGAWANAWIGREIFRCARHHATGRANKDAAPTVLSRAVSAYGEDGKSVLETLTVATAWDADELEQAARLAMARLSLRGPDTRRRMQVLGQRMAGVTLKAVSDRVGVTKERVRQIQLSAIQELREYLDSGEAPLEAELVAGGV